MKVSEILHEIRQGSDQQEYKDLHWEGSFADYLEMVLREPSVARSAYQRIYDMIISYGSEDYVDHRKNVTKYRFFSDPLENGKDAIFGLDVPLMKLVNLFNASARRYGPEKRVLLLHGPVGSSKSTIVRLLKKGLAAYSLTPAGRVYTFSWMPLEIPHRQELFGSVESFPCPMHEDPLRLIPREPRERILNELNRDLSEEHKVAVEGDLCPPCRYFFRELMGYYDGDWEQVLQHIRVRRLVLSEQDRVGIGTFQPKDEKNQDSTELTGDINYRKIAEYGSDSDPRAFNFDGEFNIANRGLIEFIEVLKLDVAFLYDLLGASQEHSIKPKKFAQTTIDEVIIGHTNEAEFRKLESNEYMEALRDRTIRIDIPYITKLHQEIKIYERDFNAKRIKGKHIAPHTIEMAAMWAVLTRLEAPARIRLDGVHPGRIPMVQTWRNDGVAPCTESYALEFSLVDRAGRTVAREPFYPKTPTTHWTPGETVEEYTSLSVPADVRPGTYTLKVAMPRRPDNVVDPTGRRPERGRTILLGIAGRDNEDRYGLCPIECVRIRPRQSLVYQAGFEADESLWKASPGVKVSRDGRAGRTGRSAMRVEGTQEGAWNFASFKLSQSILPGSRYRLACWMRVAASEGRPPFMKFCPLDREGRSLTNHNTGRYDSSAMDTWQRLSIAFETAANAVGGLLAIEKGRTTRAEIKLWLDDVTVELLEAP